jgi:hypothetical protein
MVGALHLEVLLALIYALFLVGIAFILELLARHSQSRSESYQNSGFIYFKDLDYWECPAGRQLVQLDTDHQRRVTRYQAPASACNSCSLKLNCTDSDSGRLLERRMDVRVESELRRFHRRISLTLLLVAATLLLVEAFRFAQPYDRWALVLLLVVLGFIKLNMVQPPGLERVRRSLAVYVRAGM